jgi:hypothetical protein
LRLKGIFQGVDFNKKRPNARPPKWNSKSKGLRGNNE